MPRGSSCTTPRVLVAVHGKLCKKNIDRLSI
jgi:hypothetical protein